MAPNAERRLTPYAKTVALEDFTFKNVKVVNIDTTSTATQGRPLLSTFVNIEGAFPSTARP